MARRVESMAKQVICISDSVKVFLQKCKELSNSKKCEVIYYSWIESDFFKPREWTGWQEPSWFRDAKNIITVARLVPQKNLERLIRSMLSLEIESNLDIYGVGPMHGKLRVLIKELSLDSKVHLMGFEKNIEEVLQYYDLFVLPSKYEGFGLSVLEAIVQRRKIAVARNDALSEVLGAQYPYFFEPESEESIAKTIQDALNAREEQFYDYYERILERYTPETMVTRVLKIYHQVVKSNE